MTSTEFSIGMADGRNSSKVLKPPGGGSSDIFGVQDSSEEPSEQKQAPQTKDRLFGGNEADPVTPIKNYRNKSSIFGGEEPAARKEGKKKFVRRNPITGEILEHYKSEEKDGEDANDEASEQNGNSSEQNGESGNGVVEQPEQPMVKPTSVRVRQPPGGASSGIF